MLGCRTLLRSAASGGAIVAAALSLPSEGVARTPAAKVRAHPANVMVNTDTRLTGRGFPANATITLRECAAKSWLATQDPCNSSNEVSVRTDAKGRFTTELKAELCPEGQPGRGPTERVCYVGHPASTEGTVTLEGAGRIRVSYP